ncbi:glucosaminidase domain-containing protein [Phytohabitans rumicis]|uniref:Mannosyl-glycoprotein endo-beta-N-acetylglucosamidase-like domain-containing protein n=1 Tax=Phytohabitans rumicis TaxID=1076125 RepID=A0A6V8L5R2_9ACTN|nr:glucosaminidase domain-containing protein [Phytohabitans rumicis]GFJ92592.1 hypothetical protein Prum_062340 [Phytohabitans rumicis]
MRIRRIIHTASLGVLAVAAALTTGVQPASASLQTDYIAVAGPAAQTVMQQYDIPASVTVAQSILESNWGRSGLSANDRNYFGFKCTTATNPGPIAIGCHDYPTTECTPTCHTVHAYFRVYTSMTDSFRDYGRLLTTSSSYADALPYRHDPDRFIQEIANPYATDPDYANKVINLMRTYDLYRFNSGVQVGGPMYHQVRFADGSGWSGFQPLAGYGTTAQGSARDMSVAGMPDGSAQVLIVGNDGGVYHEIRNANGTWTGFQPLPGMGTTATAQASRVAIAGLPDGSAQVLIIGADGGVYHQIRNANGTWTGFQPLAGMGTTDMARGSDVAIAGLPDGSAQVLIVGTDRGVYHQIRNANGTWTGFQPRPGVGTTDTAQASRLAIAGLPDGSSQMLIIGADGGVYHQARYPYGHTQSNPDSPDVVRVCQVETGCWSGFAPVQGMGTTDTAHGSDVTIAGLPDESAQIAIVGADGGIYHEIRNPDGAWTGFQPLPGLGTTETARGINVALAGLPDGSAQLTIVGQR